MSSKGLVEKRYSTTIFTILFVPPSMVSQREALELIKAIYDSKHCSQWSIYCAGEFGVLLYGRCAGVYSETLVWLLNHSYKDTAWKVSKRITS